MRHAALVFALLVLVAGVGAPVVAAGAAPDDPMAPSVQGSTPLALQQSENTSVGTELVIRVHPDTNATWEVVTRHELRSDADVRAFQQLVAELQSGQANSSLDEDTFRNYAELASESTGREMSVQDVRYTGRVTDDNETGVLTMTFTWTNFAEETDQNRLEVRDVFTTPDGDTWFPWLASGQTLRIVTPEGYEVRSSFQASTQSNSLVTDGPRNFRSDPVYVVYAPSEGVAPPNREGLLDMLPPELLAGVGVMLVLVVAGVWYLRQQDDEIPDAGSTPGANPRDGPAGGAAAATVDSDSPESDDPEPDLSLLSDEERVEHLLEHNGGRMRQADIVKKTGWSDAKVSQLLSSMADEDRVNKLRIGRENLISLPDKNSRPTDEP